MKKNIISKLLIIVFLLAGTVSCKKESGGGGNNVQEPKVGTTWVYRYDTYYSNGGLGTTTTVTYRAVAEESYGGESWLKINEVGPDTTVYFLKKKADGLYQYANASSNLLCKSPAAVNQTYTSFNRGADEDFQVITVNETLPTNIGDIPVTSYEGKKGGEIADQIWYNSDAWIVKHFFYRKPPLGVNYRSAALYIFSITY